MGNNLNEMVQSQQLYVIEDISLNGGTINQKPRQTLGKLQLFSTACSPKVKKLVSPLQFS